MPRKLTRCSRRVLTAATFILIVFALGFLPGGQQLGAAATQLAWNEDPASIVTGFAVTLDGVRIDYGLTPEPSSGPCGCSIPLPFTSGEHTVVLSAYNTGGETFGPPVILGPTAGAGGPYAAQTATTLAVSASGSTDNLGTITSYVWQWGDGTANTSSASPTASHVYAAAGTYTVTLTVTDDFPASNSTTTTATITGGAPQPPGAPASPNPSNGATGVSATPTLTWTAANATTYDVQFGSTNPPPSVVTGQAAASYTPATLTAGTTYFWQIIAHGSGGATTGPVWSFATSATTTVTYVSDTFTGANGTALGSHTPDIGARWVDEEPGANIQSNELESTNFSGGRAYNPTLPATADYQVSVNVTMAIAGWGNQGGVRGRDTSGVFGGPAYEAYFNDGNKTWYLAYWSGGNSTTIGTSPDPGFTSGTKTITLQMSGSTISVSVAGATIISVTDTHVPANGYPGIVNNGGLNTAMLLDNYLVTTVGGTPPPPPGTPPPPSGTPPPPGTPASPNPSNGATSVSTTPTLTWTATNATSYDVEFGTTNPPSFMITGQSAAYMPAALTAGTTYFWQIIAHGGGGTTTGPVWSFATSATTTVTYVSDTFTDANGTALGSHTPDIGARWVDEEAGANIQSNRLESTSFMGGRAYNPTLPPSADYQVSVDVTMAIAGWGNQGGVRGRDTSASVGSVFGGPAYEAYFNESNKTWYLAYWIGGNPTTIGTSPDAGFTSGTKTLTLQMSGSTISVSVAGATIISVTDTHVPANGYPGIVNNGGLNTAMLLDNYLVTTVGGTPPPPPGTPPPPPGTLPPPGTPASPNPSNGATGVSTTPTLTWSATNAASYDVEFGTANPPSFMITGQSASSYAPAALTAGATYFWQIVAHGVGGTTAGPVWSFTTTNAPQPASNVVIYASDIPAAQVHGAWQLTSDVTSPNGLKLATADLGAPATSAPQAVPTDYVDVPFPADAATPYTLWLRMRALNDSKFNDSLWVQFSDALVNGSEAYPINSTAGLLVNLATDASGASLNGWGWANGAYWLVQPATVTFASAGAHTLRLQVREDGVEFDQVVLSPTTFLNAPPGPPTNDSTIVPK